MPPEAGPRRARPEVLVVDDELNIRRMIRALLEAEGHTVGDADSAEAALEIVRAEPPEVVLLDLALPGLSGLDAIRELRRIAPGLPVVMMSGRATLSDAVEATRRGAFHFIEKPLAAEAVLLTLRGALEVARARDLARALREELGPAAELVGSSPAMQRVREVVRRVAPTEARVLVTGESGTGKELIASAIHGLSSRAGGPFIRVNSAALPQTLIESELFGHERGAFTGATERRRGRFELAHEGTLFLDEIGDLSPEAQAKLLRALETGVVERVGGSAEVRVDVRVVAATNRDLRDGVTQGWFREDLLFRLEVVPLHVPPLRERPEDVPELVRHACERLLRRSGIAPPEVTPEGMTALGRHPWPGNVRELFNIVERIAILHPGRRAGRAEVADVLSGRGAGGAAADRAVGPTAAPSVDPDDPRPLRERLDLYERAVIRAALDRTGANVAATARLLQTDRGNLYRRMRRLGIGPDDEGVSD